MTDKEKAIVMAHTGICMLEGNKFQIFHKYVEDIMNRPIMTHELGWLRDEIKEKSKADFMALCANESNSEIPKNSPTETLISLDVYKEVAKERDIAIQQLHELGYEFGQKIEPVIRDNGIKDELNRVKDELEPTTENCESCKYYGLHHEVCNYCYKCSLWTEKEPTIKNDIGVDCISSKIAKEMNLEVANMKKIVQALSSVTPKECVDCVSRKAVDELVWKYLRKETDETIAFYEHFLDLPPVTPIRPKGHWITRPHVYGVAFCSECGFELKINNTNYCPNCSADMREVEE